MAQEEPLRHFSLTDDALPGAARLGHSGLGPEHTGCSHAAAARLGLGSHRGGGRHFVHHDGADAGKIETRAGTVRRSIWLGRHNSTRKRTIAMRIL